MKLRAIILALGLALAGCPKKGKTTPTGGGSGSGGGSDAVGMSDGTNPDGGDDLPGGGGGDDLPGGGGGGDDLPGGTGDGSGSEQPEEEKPRPHFVPENMDPDPDKASAGVKNHLKAAKDALNATDPDLAISEAKEALKIDGTNITAVVILAHAYYQKKLYDTAETILDMLLKDRKDAAPKNSYVYYVYGLVYDKTNEPVKALKAYQKAVELKPDYGNALVNLGVHQLRNKQYDDAMQTYEKLSGDLGYTDAKTWNSLGSAYRGKSADYDPGTESKNSWLLKAETAFKKSTQADRNYGPAYYNLGLLYLDGDPFPDGSGGSMDNLARLNQAKTYFDSYKDMPGVDIKLYDERMKNVTKLIKREEKKRKKGT